MNKKTDSDGILHNKILASAAEMFQKQGYTTTFLSDISAKAGVKNSDISRTIGSKRDILKLLFDEERDSVRMRIQKVLEGVDPKDINETAEALMKVFYIVQNSSFLTMIYRFEDFPVWYCMKNIEDSFSRENSLIENFLNRCQEEGSLRPGELPVITHAFRSMLSLVLNESELVGQSPDTFDMMIRIFVDGMLSGAINDTNKG